MHADQFMYTLNGPRNPQHNYMIHTSEPVSVDLCFLCFLSFFFFFFFFSSSPLTSAPSLLSLVSGWPRCKLAHTDKIDPAKNNNLASLSASGKGLTFLLVLGSGCAAAGGVVGGEASLQELIRGDTLHHWQEQSTAHSWQLTLGFLVWLQTLPL